jgi:cobaltochelatase CobT
MAGRDEREPALRQRRIEDLCGAAIRAVAGQPRLQWRGGRLWDGASRLPRFASHLEPRFGHADLRSFRGAADGLALRVALSDTALHRRRQPADAVQRLVFDMLEQFRVESLAPAVQRGLRHNLEHRFRAWSDEFIASGLIEGALGILLFTVSQVARTRITGEHLPEPVADLIEGTRFGLADMLGPAMRELRRLREHQEAFASVALELSARVAERARSEREQSGEAADADGDDARETRNGFELLLEPEAGDGEALPLATSARSGHAAEAAGYRVFTTAWDRELDAARLVRPQLLLELRERLDALAAASGIHVGRLAAQLRALLASEQSDGWEGGHEQGRLDGRRLTQLVVSPGERRLFLQQPRCLLADCMVSLLVDCSGSMRQHAEPVALLVDTFSRALDLAGVDHEVLGFTTAAWNGGRARRDWLRAGQPREPGRLNEVQHLVFKARELSWRRSRRGIAALLKPDLYREGVDGEAVQWACARMQGLGHRRRVLLVVSDGCPMDTASENANAPGYLEQHLTEVVARAWAQRDAEVMGVGVGLDLGALYPRSVALDLSQLRGNGVLRELLGLIDSRRRGSCPPPSRPS